MPSGESSSLSRARGTAGRARAGEAAEAPRAGQQGQGQEQDAHVRKEGLSFQTSR